MTYRDAAIADYESVLATANSALIAEAREAVRPCLIDSTGKIVLDPAKGLDVTDVVPASSLVVLTTNDGSSVTFIAQKTDGTWTVRLGKFIDGRWNPGATVKDMDEVGAALKAEVA